MGADNKWLELWRLCGPWCKTQLYSCNQNMDLQHVHQQSWLCFNKTLSISLWWYKLWWSRALSDILWQNLKNLKITGNHWNLMENVKQYACLGCLHRTRDSHRTALGHYRVLRSFTAHSLADCTNTPQSSEALAWGHVWEILSDAWCHSSQYRAVKMGSWEESSVADLLATLAWELEFEHLRLTLKKANGWSWDVAQ